MTVNPDPLPPTVTDFVEALEAAGVDAPGRRRFHAALERRRPDLHETLLRLLGLPPDERAAIVARSRDDASLLPR